MLPLTEAQQHKHRAAKRLWERTLTLGFLRETIPDHHPRLQILEFGCGRASGADMLSGLGNLVLSDVYRDEKLEIPPGARFVQCSITESPFESGQFDLILSNHVLEHIDRTHLAQTFAELKRISSADAKFSIAVPTTTWLLLSIPGQLWDIPTNRALAKLGICSSQLFILSKAST